MSDVAPSFVGFLRARIAEEEAKAIAASPGPWSPKSSDDISYGEYGWYVTGPSGSPECDDSEQGKADTVFIGSFDPPLVLAMCAVLRSALDALDIAGDLGSEPWVLIRDVIVKPMAGLWANHDDFNRRWVE